MLVIGTGCRLLRHDTSAGNGRVAGTPLPWLSQLDNSCSHSFSSDGLIMLIEIVMALYRRPSCSSDRHVHHELCSAFDLRGRKTSDCASALTFSGAVSVSPPVPLACWSRSLIASSQEKSVTALTTWFHVNGLLTYFP